MGLTLKQKAAERLSRGKSLAIATARENSAMVQDVFDNVVDNYTAGASWEDSVNAAMEPLKERAIERYGPRIRAALRRAGLEFPDDMVLSVESVQDLLSEQSGLDIEALTGEGVADAIDTLLSKRLSETLGVPITSVLNAEGLKTAVEAGVRQAIENGTAERLITAGLSKAARRLATWKRNGVPEREEQQRILHGWYQKKYARTHRQVWS